ncbi:hypothetical protein D3C83_183310 [compost metagenome]
MPVDDGAAGMVLYRIRERSIPVGNRPGAEPLDQVHQESLRAAASMRLHASSRLASELANETRKYGDRP